MRIFSLSDFSRLLVLFVYSELTAIFVKQPPMNGYKKSKAVYVRQHFRRSSIRMGPFFFKGQVYEWVGFEILARTPVLQLTPSYLPPLPPPPPPTHTHTHTPTPRCTCKVILRSWLDVAKVLSILLHRGVQLILAYSWARPAILVVG